VHIGNKIKKELAMFDKQLEHTTEMNDKQQKLLQSKLNAAEHVHYTNEQY